MISGRTWRRCRTLPSAFLILLAALGLSACGVPTAAEPSAIPPSQLPGDLLAPASAGGPSAVKLPDSGGASIDIFLFFHGALVPVVRQVAKPATLADALEALANPTARELASGYVSYIPFATPLSVGTPDHAGIVVVNLSASFYLLVGGQDAPDADAQIVFTATAYPGVSGVIFEQGGLPTPAEALNGHIFSTPATRADYQELADRS
jgi:hypothetical protein